MTRVLALLLLLFSWPAYAQVLGPSCTASFPCTVTTGTGSTATIYLGGTAVSSGNPFPVTGTVTANQGAQGTIGNAWYFQDTLGGAVLSATNPVPVSPGTGATFTVTASALPLPSGAATAANQTTSNASLSTIATNTGAATPAGTNLIGKVGIDQTTPGTTNNVTVTPQAVTVTWAGGSVTTGGSFQSALAASSSRNGCQIQNTSSAIEYINSSASPTTSNSNQINPYGTYTCSVTSMLVDQAAIKISGATTGQTYVVSSW